MQLRPPAAPPANTFAGPLLAFNLLPCVSPLLPLVACCSAERAALNQDRAPLRQLSAYSRPAA